MNGIVFFCVLFFCGVSGYTQVSDAYSFISENMPTDLVKKAKAGVDALLNSYLYYPITHNGSFLEGTIRGYDMLRSNEGRFVFGSLDGELNQSFRSLMRRGHPRTGDIISCRIPSSRMAEHYMMVLNKNIIEVGVVGGKTSHNGVIIYDSYRNSSYINSTECLYHENQLISKAEEIDDRNDNDKETDQRYQEIQNRILCTMKGKNLGRFNYDLISCNCQDLVLYWAYGYVENNCLEAFFNGCSQYLTNTLPQILNVTADENIRELLKLNVVGLFILRNQKVLKSGSLLLLDAVGSRLYGNK